MINMTKLVLSFLFTFVIIFQQTSSNPTKDSLEDFVEDVFEVLTEDELKTKRIASKDLLLLNYKKINPDTYSDCITATRHADINCGLASDETHSIDGSCNNFQFQAQGVAHTKVRRLMSKTSYIDGDIPVGYPTLHTSETPRLTNGYPFLHLDKSVPTPQEVSEKVFKSISIDRKTTDEKLAHIFMAFGQFIDHNLALTEHAEGVCKKPTCKTFKDFQYPCFPILRSSSSNQGCASFTRSKAECSTKGQTRDQVNNLAAYLDASAVYGSSLEKLEKLRWEKGLLLTSANNLPPFDSTSKEPCQQRGGCFHVGDVRVNEHIGLATMHTVWLRFHNYIASKLDQTWTNDEIFYSARRILIAVLQHITYNEWLPLVTSISPYVGYNESVDSTLSNVFQTAAFRFGHSLIRNSFEQLDNNFNEVRPPIPLQVCFQNMKPLIDHGIEATVYGLMANTSNKIDVEFAEGVMEKLFIAPSDKKGFQNLLARNIQRGRDHGLPSYFEFKKFFNQEVKSSQFEPDVLAAINKLYLDKNGNFLYADPFVAGIAEKPDRNKVVGPLFGAIIREQFERLRDGDRFYYENPDMFSNEQLLEIKKFDMGYVLCVTLNDIVSVQSNVFEAFDPVNNYRRSCTNRKLFDFSKFAEQVDFNH